jgi:hypothetical protein
MLMQPQSPDPQFDFMLNNNPQPKRAVALPAMSKPVKIVVFTIIAVLILIVISSLLSGRKASGTQSIPSAVAREQEILRVTQLVQTQQTLRDPGTTALAATVTASLSSQQAQITAYLAQSHIKLSKLQLAADTDKTTDAQLQDASQNNQLDSAYKNYLKQALAKYQSELQTAYNSAGPNGKVLLKDAFDSTATLLNNPPLKS